MNSGWMLAQLHKTIPKNELLNVLVATSHVEERAQTRLDTKYSAQELTSNVAHNWNNSHRPVDRQCSTIQHSVTTEWAL
jgi:hypothetical protein